MDKSNKAVKAYVTSLETQYNLLFDYMWSMGTLKYLKFLKDKGFEDYREHHRYTRRITSLHEWNKGDSNAKQNS